LTWTKQNFHGIGNPGDNTIYSGGGDDILEGGAGNDYIVSDKAFFGTAKPAGRDTLIGGPGDDYLMGGAGADLFVMRDGDGHDTVVDFTIESVEAATGQKRPLYAPNRDCPRRINLADGTWRALRSCLLARTRPRNSPDSRFASS